MGQPYLNFHLWFRRTGLFPCLFVEATKPVSSHDGAAMPKAPILFSFVLLSGGVISDLTIKIHRLRNCLVPPEATAMPLGPNSSFVRPFLRPGQPIRHLNDLLAFWSGMADVRWW